MLGSIFTPSRSGFSTLSRMFPRSWSRLALLYSSRVPSARPALRAKKKTNFSTGRSPNVAGLRGEAALALLPVRPIPGLTGQFTPKLSSRAKSRVCASRRVVGPICGFLSVLVTILGCPILAQRGWETITALSLSVPYHGCWGASATTNGRERGPRQAVLAGVRSGACLDGKSRCPPQDLSRVIRVGPGSPGLWVGLGWLLQILEVDSCSLHR